MSPSPAQEPRSLNVDTSSLEPRLDRERPSRAKPLTLTAAGVSTLIETSITNFTSKAQFYLKGFNTSQVLAMLQESFTAATCIHRYRLLRLFAEKRIRYVSRSPLCPVQIALKTYRRFLTLPASTPPQLEPSPTTVPPGRRQQHLVYYYISTLLVHHSLARTSI